MATTTSVTRSGDQRIDGELSGTRWVGTLTYSDPDAGSDYDYSYDRDGDGVGARDENFSQLSAIQLAAVHAVLSADANTVAARAGFSVEGLTNLDVAYVAGGSGAADIRLANSSDAGTAYAFYPSSSSSGGDVWFGPAGDVPVIGTYDYHAVMHEIGHALGLKHGHETSRFGALPADYDSHEYSIMTYRSYPGSPGAYYTNGTYDGPQSFMMADIAALQYMYGADFTTNSGNTTYRWTPGAGTTFVDGQAAISPGGNRIFLTVWDGGGVDTYDLSAYSGALRIDLSPGASSTFSDVQRAYLGGGYTAIGNVYNALQYQGDARSLIENATGGNGSDSIAGNVANNTLLGRGGIDTLSGREGADSLDGGAGADTMNGGSGDDVYFVDNAGDVTVEDSAAGGHDLVNSAVSRTLGDNIEELKLWGSAATGTGNTLNNYLVGSGVANTLRGVTGNDTLNGKAGADILIGGIGNDFFRFEATTDSTGSARDTIRGEGGVTAFQGAGAAAGDRIDLSLIDSNLSAAGNNTFVFSANGGAGSGTGAGRVWAVDVGQNTCIRANVDGGSYDLEIVIADAGVKASAYNQTDFVL